VQLPFFLLSLSLPPFFYIYIYSTPLLKRVLFLFLGLFFIFFIFSLSLSLFYFFSFCIYPIHILSLMTSLLSKADHYNESTLHYYHYLPAPVPVTQILSSVRFTDSTQQSDPEMHALRTMLSAHRALPYSGRQTCSNTKNNTLNNRLAYVEALVGKFLSMAVLVLVFVTHSFIFIFMYISYRYQRSRD
jgi:hypothetical protein